MATTERATDLLNSDNHFVHTLLRHMLPVALNIEAVRRKGAGILSELGVQYRKSSLNGRSDSAIHAGARFPDVAISDSESERALDLLDPTRITVLVTGPATLQLTPYGNLVTERRVPVPGHALQAALGDASVALVRPDGYLLCAGSPAFVEAELDAWGRRWLNAPAQAWQRPSIRPDRAAGSSAPH